MILNMKRDQNQIEIYNMKRQIINTQKSPDPIGPYNQAIFINNMLFISGQIALDPNSMVLNNNSIKDEAHQVMINLKNILKEVNMDFRNVVKSTIFLSDMSHFKEINEVYGGRFGDGSWRRINGFPVYWDYRRNTEKCSMVSGKLFYLSEIEYIRYYLKNY